MRYALGLDVGGTNLSAGVVDENGMVISHAVMPAGAGRSIAAITSDMVGVSRRAVNNLYFPGIFLTNTSFECVGNA